MLFYICENIEENDEIISEIIEKYNDLKPDTLMVLTEVEDPSAFGVVEIDDGNIKNIIEKPKKEEAPSNLVNTGIYVFNKDIFEKIKKSHSELIFLNDNISISCQ